MVKYIAQDGPEVGQVWLRDFFIAAYDGFLTDSGTFYQYQGEYDSETDEAKVWSGIEAAPVEETQAIQATEETQDTTTVKGAKGGKQSG